MLNEQQAWQILIKGYQFYPFQLSVQAIDRARSDLRVDWLMELKWQETVARFAVEYRMTATPKQLEGAIGLVRSLNEFNPMIMAPYFNRDALQRLTDATISGIDLSGNGVVLLNDKWLVYKTGAPNRYPASAEIKAVFDGTSSLVGRIFLIKREFPLLKDIKEAIEVAGGAISLGTISKVVKVLEEEILVTRESTIRLLQPRQLLDKLRENYIPPEPTGRRLLQLTRAQLQSLCTEAVESKVRIAVSGESRYALFPGSERQMRAYITNLSVLGAYPATAVVERFGNIEFFETTDQRVYFDARFQDNIYWTSPFQTYLDLSTQGKRERETAEQLIPLILGFRE